MSETADKSIEDLADKLSGGGVRVILAKKDAEALARIHYENLGKEKVQITIRRAIRNFIYNHGENQ